MKRTPMKRKKSLREYCEAKRLALSKHAKRVGGEEIAQKGQFLTLERVPKGKRPKRMKKTSTKRAAEMQLYYQERAEYLRRDDRAACAICLCLGMTPAPATEVHHARGRNGSLLRDQRFWVPSCFHCREVPHKRPNWARKMGILSSAAEWGISPEKMPK